MENFHPLLNDIFYSFAVFAIYYEFKVVWRPSHVFAMGEGLRGKKVSDLKGHEMVLPFMESLYHLWLFFGLFSQQGFLFLFIYLLSLSPLKKNVRGLFWDGLLTLIVLCFMIAARYIFHLRFDIVH